MGRNTWLGGFALSMVVATVGSEMGCSSSEATSSSNASPDGGTTEAGTPASEGGAQTEAKPHPLCADPANKAPADMGKACAMGSNLDLCASPKDSPECESKVCVWDARDGVGDTYCSTPCDAAPCPEGYACVSQDCTLEVPRVCVRNGPPPTFACSRVFLESEPSRTFYAHSLAVGPDRRQYVAGEITNPKATAVLSRAVGSGTWSKLAEWSEPIASNDGDSVRTKTGGAMVVASRALVVADPAGASIATLSATPCNGCASVLLAPFVTATGEVRALAAGGEKTFAMIAKAGGLEVAGTFDGSLLHRSISTFAKGGVAALCGPAPGRLCVSNDGAQFKDIALPSGETDATAVVAGESTDDFYYYGRTGQLYRYLEGEWIKEAVPIGAPLKKATEDVAHLAVGGDGGIYVVWSTGAGKSTGYRLTGERCWKKIEQNAFGRGLVADTGTMFLRRSFNDVCPVRLE